MSVLTEKVYGRQHLKTASAISRVAESYIDLGEYAKALPLHERVLAIREKAMGPDHPENCGCSQ